MTSNDEDIEEIVLVNNEPQSNGPIKSKRRVNFEFVNGNDGDGDDDDDGDDDGDDGDDDGDGDDGDDDGDDESEIEDGSMEELMNSFFTNDEGDNIADIMTGILKGLEKQNAILMKIGAVISKKN